MYEILGRRGRFIVPIADLSAPNCIKLARKGISGDASLSDIARLEVDAVGGSLALHRIGTAAIHKG